MNSDNTKSMPMKNPPHPGMGIDRDIEELGLSIHQVAEALNMDPFTFHKTIQGFYPITAELAIKLEHVIGSTAEHWLRLQNAYDLAKVRNGADVTKGLKKLYKQVA